MIDSKLKEKYENKLKHLSGVVKTVSIPAEYDDDIIDYLMEVSDSIVTEIDNELQDMLELLNIKESVTAFIHWVDESDYKEYITYIYTPN